MLKKYYIGGGKNKGIIFLKFIAAFFITYSHMGILFPKYGGLVTRGAIGDGLFFFCSRYTLFLGRQDRFIDWYKRRINRIYPTIIVWALLSSVLLRWEWGITDVITTPRYWFIPCIMIYYAIFYFIRKYFYECLHIVFVIALVVSLISYVIILDLNHSVMDAAVPYMRIYYFLFMLMGAIVAIKKKTGVTPGRAAVYAVLNLVLYFVWEYIRSILFSVNFRLYHYFPYYLQSIGYTVFVILLLSLKYFRQDVDL